MSKDILSNLQAYLKALDNIPKNSGNGWTSEATQTGHELIQSILDSMPLEVAQSIAAIVHN